MKIKNVANAKKKKNSVRITVTNQNTVIKKRTIKSTTTFVSTKMALKPLKQGEKET